MPTDGSNPLKDVLQGSNGLYVTVLLDRSGSMEAIREDTIGAFNAFLADLKADAGATVVTLAQFDSQAVDVLYDGAPVAAVAPLTLATFQPRGTPLFDAAGRIIVRTEERVRQLRWEESVLFVMITDGNENSSIEWTREQVFAKVKEREAAGWAFIYLGAHAEAYAEGNRIGVAPGSQARWNKSAGGAREMGSSLAASAKGFRTKERLARDLILDEERRKMDSAR